MRAPRSFASLRSARSQHARRNWAASGGSSTASRNPSADEGCMSMKASSSFRIGPMPSLGSLALASWLNCGRPPNLPA